MTAGVYQCCSSLVLIGKCMKHFFFFLIRTIGLLFFLSIAIFVLAEILPGDATSKVAGSQGLDAAEIARIQLGLDKPIYVRYGSWITQLFAGDFGISYDSGLPITGMIKLPFVNTLLLAAVSLAGVIVLGVGLGVLMGTNPGSFLDKFFTTSVLGITAIPEFVIAIIISAVIAIKLQLLAPVYLLPLGETIFSRPIAMVLPALTLIIFISAYVARMVRGLVAAQNNAPWVIDSGLAGLPRFTVITKHLLPSVIPGIVQVIAMVVPALVGGSVVVERVFAYPGIGLLLINAVNARDTPIVAGIGAILGLISILGFSAADAISRRSAAREVTTI